MPRKDQVTLPEPLPETAVLANHHSKNLGHTDSQIHRFTDAYTAVFIEVAPQLKKQFLTQFFLDPNIFSKQKFSRPIFF